MSENLSTLQLRFEGPFSWRTDTGVPCIFDDPLGKRRGIYIWTAPHGDERLVYYVGETGRTFASRHMEHLREHMAGFYHLFEPKVFSGGRKNVVWNGMYGRKTREPVKSLFSRWPELAPIIEQQTKIIQFFLAVCDASLDVRREIERALAIHLESSARNFQDGGIWYRGAKAPMPSQSVQISASCAIVDLPSALEIGGDNNAIGYSSRGVFITAGRNASE